MDTTTPNKNGEQQPGAGGRSLRLRDRASLPSARVPVASADDSDDNSDVYTPASKQSRGGKGGSGFKVSKGKKRDSRGEEVPPKPSRGRGRPPNKSVKPAREDRGGTRREMSVNEVKKNARGYDQSFLFERSSTAAEADVEAAQGGDDRAFLFQRTMNGELSVSLRSMGLTSPASEVKYQSHTPDDEKLYPNTALQPQQKDPPGSPPLLTSKQAALRCLNFLDVQFSRFALFYPRDSVAFKQTWMRFLNELSTMLTFTLRADDAATPPFGGKGGAVLRLGVFSPGAARNDSVNNDDGDDLAVETEASELCEKIKAEIEMIKGKLAGDLGFIGSERELLGYLEGQVRGVMRLVLETDV